MLGQLIGKAISKGIKKRKEIRSNIVGDLKELRKTRKAGRAGRKEARRANRKRIGQNGLDVGSFLLKSLLSGNK